MITNSLALKQWYQNDIDFATSVVTHEHGSSLFSEWSNYNSYQAFYRTNAKTGY